MCAGKLHKPIKTSRKPMVATTLSRFTKETTRENDRHPLEASASTVNAKHPGLQKIGEINRNCSFNRHVVKAELSTDRKNRSTAKVRSSKQECCNQKEVGASNFNGTEQCLISEGLDTDAALNTATTGKIHSGSDVCAMQGSLKNVTRDSCANEFLNSSVQDSAVSLKTLGHPRQNVHAVFSTLPGDRRGYKSGDVVTALQDSPGEKDEFLGNQHPCKHGISSAHSSFPCSHCHNNHSVKDDAHVEGAAPQFKLNADIQDLIHKLENDVRNIKVDVETITKAKTVQEASVQTSPKTSIHFGSSSGSMDALSMYFPSMFPDGSDPVPPPAAAPSINRGNDRLLEDLWQCLHDVQRRQHVLTDNLDMTTHVRHCEELRSLMELLPANPSIFSERMTIKQRVDECTSSVRAEILAAVAAQLNAEKQSRSSRHQPANHSLDRGKCVRLGQGRNIPRGNPGTKPAVSSTRTIRGTQKSTSPSKALLPSPMNRTCKLPQHPRPKQPNSNQKLRSDLLWCEDNHRHVYGNLLGLGKQSREIRPYLHLRNPLPSQPVPWPPSSTHKTSSVASKEPARHLKHNPISQAFGLSLSQKSQVTSNRINELNTTSVTDRLAGVDKEVKKMKPSVTFLDPSPNSSVSLESTNKMLGSSQKLNTTENSMDLLESDSQNSTIDHELGEMITNDSLDTHAETVEEDTANPVINGEGSDESVTSDESAVDSTNKDSSMNPTASPPSGFLEATDVSVTENAGCNDREDCSELLAAVSSKEDNSHVAQQVIDEDLKEQPQEGVTVLSSNVDALKTLIDATDMLMITSEAIANSIATHHENNYVADARHLQAPSPVAANSSIVIKPMSSLNTRDLQARSAPPTNLSVPKQQSSSEQYLNEAKYWIEQELLARSLSLLLPVQEVTRPALSLQQPNTEPPSFVDLSEIPDKESWLINIIGDEGVKLFQEADTPVDTELVCQLIQDVISEQAITRVLALRKTSKQEDSGSEASLEPPSESYSKDTFVSESGSDVAAENEVLHEEDLVKKPQMVESLPTPIVTPLGSPKNSKTVQEAEIETEFPLQLTAPFYNFPDDRPVTPLLSESASESEEKEERLLGGGLLLPESDPMHPDSENPSNPAGTPPTSPPPQTLNQSTSVHEQINPPTTPQLSAATESSLASLATGGHMEQASVWNQGTQTTPRRMVPENRYQADDQPTLSNANASVLNILPRQTVSTVDQGVGTSPPSSHGRVNGEIEFPEADFDLSEGEWLMYQRQIRRMLPAARNAAQGSSQTFNLSHGSGSMDNTLRDSEELELDPLSEGEIPFSFSPEWLSSILSLIAELQSSGQVPGQSLSNDAAFITAARNLVSGSTSRLPSPGEITSPRALSRQHLRQPLRLSTAGRVTSHITSNPAFTPGDPTQPAYTQHLLSTSVTVITDSSSDSTQGNEASESNVVAYEPAEPVFVTESQPVDDRRTRCPRVSEGEVRPSVVPTLGHQSEPLHNSSPMVTVPFNLLKRSSSTPAVSSSSISQRRFVGGIPAARSQVAAEVKVTSTVSPTLVTPVTTVSQPLISHRSSVNNHVDRENIEIATEPFLIMEGFPVQQRGQSETVTSVNTVSERESQVHDSPVYKLTAAREEIALSLPKEESLMVRLTNALDDRARASNTTDTNSVNLQNGRSEEGITCSRTNVKDIQEVTNKSCSSPGQVSSPIASSPLAETRSASTSISEGEARLN